jgi:hypothetical protein
MRCSLAMIVLVVGLGGCTQGICSRNSECAPGFVCSTYGTCMIPPDAATDASDQPGSGTSTGQDAATTPADAETQPGLDGDL